MSVACISLFWPNFYVSQLSSTNPIKIVHKLEFGIWQWNYETKYPSQVVYFSKILEIFSYALMTQSAQKQKKYKTLLRTIHLRCQQFFMIFDPSPFPLAVFY